VTRVSLTLADALDMSSMKDFDPGWPQLDPSSVVMSRTLFNLDNPDAKQLTEEGTARKSPKHRRPS